MPLSTEEDSLRKTPILFTFYLKITSLGSGGHEVYNVMSLYRTDTTYQIWPRLAK